MARPGREGDLKPTSPELFMRSKGALDQSSAPFLVPSLPFEVFDSLRFAHLAGYAAGNFRLVAEVIACRFL